MEVSCVPLTVGEACNPSESGNGHVGHIPIHAEGEGGECVDTQVDQGVNGRHPSSHLLTPGKENFVQSS